MVSIAGFGTLTFLIACLPGYNSLGVWALVLLIVLRFVDGVFMGGEYTSNNTLALEMVPKDRRASSAACCKAPSRSASRWFPPSPASCSR